MERLIDMENTEWICSIDIERSSDGRMHFAKIRCVGTEFEHVVFEREIPLVDIMRFVTNRVAERLDKAHGAKT